MFSNTTGYALRAVIHIAGHQQDGPVPGSAVAEALDAPANYMSKTLHGLVRAGILDSTRGKHGGFRLAKAPEELRLVEVASVFDRVDEQRRCFLGRPECRDDRPCPMHERWKPLADAFAEFLRETTVADLMTGAPATPR